MAAASSRECRGAKSAVPVTPPVRPLWGEEATGRRVSVGHVPHALMYLSLKMDVTTPHKEVQLEEEILYQYPASEASAGLKGARGIYLTLCDMLENVTGGQIVSSTLLLDKHLVHVGYWKEGDALLVVGLPAERVPLLCLQSLVADAVRTLRVMHGSLDRAFRPTEHAPELDRFFCLFFQDLIQPSHLGDTHLATPPEISGSRLLNRLPAVRWLTLPAKVKTDLDSVLSDFEASDFGEMSEDFFGIRRLYGILGSCLFFKSYLIANHLPKEDLLDICVYMQHYYLLPAVSQQRVGQLVIWREVFPLGHPRGRHFLLIVGLRSWMQCVLLEVRGCTANSFAPPGPDCVYVDQVKATLLRLEIMEETIEKHLSGPAAPPPFCADSLLQGGSPQARLDGLAQGSSFLGEKGRDSGVEGNMDTNPVVQWRKPSNPSYLGTLMKTLSRRDADEIPGPGAENTVFHYVLVETVQGIFIESGQTEEAPLGGSLHPLLIRNFYRCCLSIRAVLKDNMLVRDRRVPETPQGLGPVKEHGVLFQCVLENWADQRKPAPTLTYWVVGRLVLQPVPQELYVCFPNSVPALPVEMAFKLSFGLAT
ncbi:protein inturned isoform X3 [Syngnathoides biaculeatus]|uniref:protein inturned isoform X3 n=1 Tax=Syngnathoides biaculeatus TaxID=300417 RepID=UPI002ADD624D|nr:protein inturned isoform X3 [Syngnathoides biaculeatus]